MPCPRRMLPLTLVSVALLQAISTVSSRAEGSFIDKYLVKGYDHQVTFGSSTSYVPGQWNPPFGTVDVSQMTEKAGKPGAPSILGFVDAVSFTSDTSAVEVFGIAPAVGSVIPTNSSFTSAGRVDVAVEGIAIFYEFNTLTHVYDVAGADVGTIYVRSSLAGPADIDSVRERSTYVLRNGLDKHSFSIKTDYKGRFGYGATGTVSIWFEGTVSVPIVPASTAVDPAESRFGFVQSGSVSAQK